MPKTRIELYERSATRSRRRRRRRRGRPLLVLLLHPRGAARPRLPSPPREHALRRAGASKEEEPRRLKPTRTERVGS